MIMNDICGSRVTAATSICALMETMMQTVQSAFFLNLNQ